MERSVLLVLRSLKRFLDIENYDVVGFYPYTSIVVNRIIESDYDIKRETDVMLKSFFDGAMMKAELLGCRLDNKIAIELRPIISKNNTLDDMVSSTIFVGYKDGRYSVGLSVFQPDSWTSKHNKKFN